MGRATCPQCGGTPSDYICVDCRTSGADLPESWGEDSGPYCTGQRHRWVFVDQSGDHYRWYVCLICGRRRVTVTKTEEKDE